MLDDQLRRADLVVNLRSPTMGEASYSQLRAMKHGVPTVVSRAGWYGELPPEAVVQRDAGVRSRGDRRVLAALDGRAEGLRAIGECGRRLLLTNHAPAAYVEGAFAFAAAHAHSIRPVAEALAARIAHDVLPLARSGDLLVEAAARCGDFLTDSDGAR